MFLNNFIILVFKIKTTLKTTLQYNIKNRINCHDCNQL